jgi:hypothetical protein
MARFHIQVSGGKLQTSETTMLPMLLRVPTSNSEMVHRFSQKLESMSRKWRSPDPRTFLLPTYSNNNTADAQSFEVELTLVLT